MGYLFLQQTPMTLPHIINHLDNVYFPPQQLIHLAEIKETWSSLNSDIEIFTDKFNPKLSLLIDTHNNIVKKTTDVLDRLPTTNLSAGAAGIQEEPNTENSKPGAVSARSARFRGGAVSARASPGGTSDAATALARSNPANRRLAVEWENFAKK